MTFDARYVAGDRDVYSDCSRQYADECQVDKTIVDALGILLEKDFVLGRNGNEINFAHIFYGPVLTSGCFSIISVYERSTRFSVQ